MIQLKKLTLGDNMVLLKQLEDFYPEIVKHRRHLHKNPELSFTEEKTPAYIADFLDTLGIEVKRNVGGRGVVGLINGKNPGKTVALRADFDALPIQEENETEYKSQNPGIMHACGHDGHTASLIAVAKVLSENRDKFNGTVKLIFQFAEELVPGGALAMIEDGCLDGVEAIFGNHFLPSLPTGTFGYRPGIFMGIADQFNIVIHGRGGHGASPHETIDPIVIASTIIVNLQQIVSRAVNPLDPSVISIGSIHAGNAFNVIADKVSISGTVRTVDKKVQEFIIQEMENTICGICEGSGATYDFEYIKGYPAVVNSQAETELVYDSMKKLVPEKDIKLVDIFLGGEDFAYYLEKVPGCFFNTGSGMPYPLHHPKFDLDEKAMLFAAKSLLSVALDFLK